MRKGFFSGWRNVLFISVGLSYALFFLWVLFNVPYFVPKGMEGTYWKIFASYGFLTVYIFGNAKIQNVLYNQKLIKFIPSFIMYLIIFMIIFSIVLGFFDVTNINNFSIVKQLPIWLALSHALIFAVSESVLWQGYLDHIMGVPASALIAGIFHMFVWNGVWYLNIIFSALLFVFFSFIHFWLGNKNKNLAPVIACHTAYNFVVLGFFLSTGGAL